MSPPWPSPGPRPVVLAEAISNPSLTSSPNSTFNPSCLCNMELSTSPQDPVPSRRGPRGPCDWTPSALPASSAALRHVPSPSHSSRRDELPILQICNTRSQPVPHGRCSLPGRPTPPASVASSRKPTSCSALQWRLCSPNLSTGHPLSSHLCSPLVSEHLEGHLL